MGERRERLHRSLRFPGEAWNPTAACGLVSEMHQTQRSVFLLASSEDVADCGLWAAVSEWRSLLPVQSIYMHRRLVS